MEALKIYTKEIRKLIYKTTPLAKEEMPKKPDDTVLIDEYMIYCLELCKFVKDRDENYGCIEELIDRVDFLKEKVDDNLEDLQLSRDTDAMVGHKTATTKFFGYKSHIAMTKSRIITATTISTGEVADCHEFPDLMDNSIKAGINVKVAIGDTAYATKDNIEYAHSKGIKLVSKLRTNVLNGTRKEEDKFDFNKDADMAVCKAGHLAIKKTKENRKTSGNPRIKYNFDVEKCKICPLREGCYKEGAKTKTYSINLSSETHLGQAEFQETELFKEEMKSRYMIEQKNADLKNNLNYAETDYIGIQGMRIQSAVTVFVANMMVIHREVMKKVCDKPKKKKLFNKKK